MLRFIIFILYAALVVLFSIFALPVMWLVGKFNINARDKMAFSIVKNVFKTVNFIIGVKTTAIGVENIPKDRAVLFVGNHLGFLDVLVSFTYMYPNSGFVAKKELAKFPLFSTYMKYIHCLFLDRDNIKEGLKTILEGIDELKNGTSLVIFPEGTRNRSKEGLLPFHAGSFKLADKSDCVVIPMTQNYTVGWEDVFPFFKKTHTVIEFGKPIDVSTMSREDKKMLLEMCQSTILETYEKNKSLV